MGTSKAFSVVDAVKLMPNSNTASKLSKVAPTQKSEKSKFEGISVTSEGVEIWSPVIEPPAERLTLPFIAQSTQLILKS